MPRRTLTAEGRERVVAAIDGGSFADAVRAYRQDTAAPVAEAEAAVRALAAGGGLGPTAGVGPVDAGVADALFAGRKVEAIKLYRLTNRVGLRQAKDAVEAIEGDLRRQHPERFATPPRSGGCGSRLVVVLIVAVAVAVAAAAWHFRHLLH